MIYPLHRSDFLHLISLFCSSNTDTKFCDISKYVPEKKIKLNGGKCLGENSHTYSEICSFSQYFNVEIQWHAAL